MSVHNNISITSETNETPNRKRTRDEVDETEVDKTPFVIRDPSDPFARPRSFTPLCLLSRTQLPLAYLDTSQSGGRLFSARVQPLEASHEHGDDYTVLIAQDEKEKRLYAIERVKWRTYALCRLRESITLAGLYERANAVLEPVEPTTKRQGTHPIEGEQPWWSRAAVAWPERDTNDNGNGLSLPELAVQRAMDAPPQAPLNPKAMQSEASDPMQQDDTQMPSAENPIAATSTVDTFQDLAKCYMEALYLSRTSLAYFAKGPLSRARAAFSPDISNSNVHELIEFLRESILTSTVMDKKYRDAVTSLVKDMPVKNLDSSEQPTKVKKKRRKWKAKRDKNGLFVEEQSFVEEWWLRLDGLSSGPSSAETTDAALRRRTPKLRNRETFLQIILVLEVLALEVSAGPRAEERHAEGNEITAQESQNADDETQSTTKAKKPKQKKKQDLSALLETLLDRLCIWHSLESHSPAKKSSGAGEDGQQEVNDELKSFCIEVIVPFYVSRTPHCAATVNKKLGGPSPLTPIKPKSSTSRKPGEPAVRQAPEKRGIRRPLERISSDVLNQSSKRPPSLHRSATDSQTMPYIKRESRDSSEVPLDSIPAAKLSRRKPSQEQAPAKRASLLHRISSSKREVDLSAMSQANEAKIRKKAEVEEKLKEAISTLKKPQRSLAVKEIAESTDERFAKATAKSAGPKGQSAITAGAAAARLKPSQSVHVTATPAKHARTVKATPYRKASATANSANAGSSSEITHVTSSSTRLTTKPTLASREDFDDVPASSPAIPQTSHRLRPAQLTGVEETPSRGFAKFMPPGLARQPGTLDSPIASRKAAVQQTPVKSMKSLRVPDIATTPVRAPPEPESIYDTLGWDDEGYEDLA